MNALRVLLRVILPVVVLGVGGLAAVKLIESRQEPDTKPPEIEPPLVRVIDATPKAVRMTVRAEGVVAPRTESQIVAEVPGRVIEVSPSLASGGFFEQGEVMLRIDPREFELSVIRARAAVAQAKLRLATEEQEAEVARKEWEALGEGEPTSLALREPQIAEAEAAVAAAEADLRQAELDLERTVSRAPYDGRVREKRVDVGQYVQRGGVAAVVYAVDSAEVRLPIPDAELAYVDLPLAYRDDAAAGLGPPVTLRAEFAGKTHEWRGRIVRTEGEIDPRTRVVYAVARVDDPYARGDKSNRPPLAVGMFVEAEIQGRSARAVEVPRSAMRTETMLMAVDRDDRLRFREVEVLRAERERTLVVGGLEPEDRVCVSTLEAAVDGMRVRVVEAPVEQAKLSD